MVKRRRVIFCDLCEKVELIPGCITMREARDWWMPPDWERVGRLHMCKRCHEAYTKAILAEK